MTPTNEKCPIEQRGIYEHLCGSCPYLGSSELATLRAEVSNLQKQNAELREALKGPKLSGIYVASKTKHAAIWRHYRDQGFPINSTWIDEAGVGETKSREDLAIRCINEAKSAEVVFLYCEPEEIHKGSLIEVGAALAAGVPVYCAGECESLSKTFDKHPLWNTASSPASFFYMFRHLRRASTVLSQNPEPQSEGKI